MISNNKNNTITYLTFKNKIIIDTPNRNNKYPHDLIKIDIHFYIIQYSTKPNY